MNCGYVISLGIRAYVPNHLSNEFGIVATDFDSILAEIPVTWCSLCYFAFTALLPVHASKHAKVISLGVNIII